MQTKPIIILTIITVLTYSIALAVQDVLFYLLFWQALLIEILLLLILSLAKCIWQLAPHNIQKKFDTKRSLFEALAIVYMFALVLIGKVFYDKLSSDTLGSVTFFGSFITFIFGAFIIWSFVRQRGTTTLVAGVFFIMLLLYGSSNQTVVKSSSEHNDTSSLRQLSSLPYVDWLPAERTLKKVGVTRYERNLAFDGFNLYSSRVEPEAYLVDMDGNVVHKWASFESTSDYWFAVEFCSNGDLLVAVFEKMLVRLDWDSNVLWTQKLRAHHSVTVDENGMIYALAREDDLVYWKCVPFPIVNDFVAIVSPDGKVKKKLYLYELLEENFGFWSVIDIYRNDWSQARFLERVCKGDRTRGFIQPLSVAPIIYRKLTTDWCLAQDSPFDILHTNNVEVLEQEVEGLCMKNDLLVSVRELDLIGILNQDKGRFVWTWGPGELDRQHSPCLLTNGNLLVFDNGPHRGFSRIIELNPQTGRIVWQYRSDPPMDFYSYIQGFCQRLPNGNTLITENMKGRVFEVTKEGDVVWEFYEPNVDHKRSRRQPIYQMKRIVGPDVIKGIQMRTTTSHSE